MTPPLFARALIAATAPPGDYESVAGDLFEEYTRRAQCGERVRADRWYWSQVFRSIPYLLSYSRLHRSFGATLARFFAIGILVLTMLVANELIGDAIHTLYRTVTGLGAWPFFLAGLADAAFFGAVAIAILGRTERELHSPVRCSCSRSSRFPSFWAFHHD